MRESKPTLTLRKKPKETEEAEAMDATDLAMDAATMSEMMEFGLQSMAEPQSFLAQLQDGQPLHEPPAALDGADFDLADLAAKNRNRGNYRCSKCGEPKKGHVCPLVPSNFKCNRCGLSKKACTCIAPSTRSIGVQVEMDEDMTTRVLDLSVQGVIEFHKALAGYPSPPHSG